MMIIPEELKPYRNFIIMLASFYDGFNEIYLTPTLLANRFGMNILIVHRMIRLLKKHEFIEYVGNSSYSINHQFFNEFAHSHFLSNSPALVII